MDDDTIEYFFDNIESFYAELDDVLNRPYTTEEDAKRVTTQYVRFLVRYQQEFLKTSVEFAQVAYKLIDSKLCLDFSTIVLAHILNHHALVSQDKAELLVSYSLLLYAGKDEPRWMDFILLESIHMKKNRLFCKIMTEVRLGFYDCYKMLSASFALCFEMCKLVKLEKQDLDLLDTSLINLFLDLVEETRGDAEESFNYDVIRLILVLNEQYMMSGTSENLVLDVLSQRPTLYEYFYTNDLYVLVDITLRELCDLGDTKESQTLRDAYLRVLEPLLENTQLRQRPYKKHETYKTLQGLLNPGMQRKVNSTTKRLVKRIIEDWWDKLCGLQVNYCLDNGSSPNLSHTSTLSSCSSGPTTPADDLGVDEISAIMTRKEVNKKIQQDTNNPDIVVV
ncbi:hypothetical protein [Parasitella parasitica]|uniref:SPIN90/Ldb17 leucine-rich domain-containing protein n=1 Tax=Parasitella parasitica TaxID=35722 RepID=A0A0B7NUR7_9FUNG|nr:hypothetical protein [Parasitella parasitica]